ncbi:MAG: MTH1187 family thiamine-binding protein [Campylobacterota bacterium]|nr:MTH1187 family thiamine-binding protein [Campylobacterota bacterium]
MSALVEFAMFPTDKSQSKSAFVARVLDIVDRSGLNYQLTPMGTIIEAESVAEVFAVIEAAYEELQEDCSRIYSAIKIDYRKGPLGRLDKKIGSVEEKLGRKLNSTSI